MTIHLSIVLFLPLACGLVAALTLYFLINSS